MIRTVNIYRGRLLTALGRDQKIRKIMIKAKVCYHLVRPIILQVDLGLLKLKNYPPTSHPADVCSRARFCRRSTVKSRGQKNSRPQIGGLEEGPASFPWVLDSNFHSIRIKPLPTNDLELTVLDLLSSTG